MHLVDKGFDVRKGWSMGAEKRGQGWKINVAWARALLPRLGADFLQWGSSSWDSNQLTMGTLKSQIRWTLCSMLAVSYKTAPVPSFSYSYIYSIHTN